jgi:formate hydrogenlyase transcriptional activator
LVYTRDIVACSPARKARFPLLAGLNIGKPVFGPQFERPVYREREQKLNLCRGGTRVAEYPQPEVDRIDGVNGNGASDDHPSIKAHLRATANLIPGHVWYATPSGALVFVNSRSADYLGLPEDHPLRFGIDLSGEWDSHIPFLHPDDHEETRRVWSTCLRTGSAGEVAFRACNKEGIYRWFLSRAEPLRASDGTLICWVGIDFDIEERKQAELELRRNKAHLADAQSLGRIGFVGMDRRTNRIFWSEEAAKIYGYSPEMEPTPELILQRSHPADVDLVKDALERAAQGGCDFDYEHRLLMPDGSIKHLHDLAHRFRDQTGSDEIVGAIMDITKHKVAEEAIRRSAAYLAEAQGLSHTGSFGWKPETDEIIWSDETYRIFEYPLSAKPTMDSVVHRVHPEDRAAFQAVIDDVSKGATDFEHTFRLLLPDGRVKHIRAIARDLQDASGSHEFIGAVTDTTEQYQAEASIKEKETELRQILDFAPQLIAVFGPRRERLYANRTSLDYFGITLEEWCDSRPGALGHPDDSGRLLSHWNNAMSSGSAFEIEVRMRKSDGSYRWFLNRFNPVRDGREQILRWYAACTDIDDRKRAEENLQRENAALREELNQSPMFEEIVGSSEPLRKVLSQINKVAPSDSTVLILGQTGTGKELIARAIHKRSRRAARAFIAVNCAAIPTSLIASELFGHEKGAFTGATQRRLGRFEAASGGTIFLDEVGDLPQDIQIALLRVLQEREIERIGSDKSIPVDVRVLAATHRDLDKLVTEGKFRQDLLYRLNVVPITMPSLRERAADIPILVEYFIARYGKKMGKKFQTIEKKTLKTLQDYRWPGNVRELQNVIERAVTLSDSDTFAVDEAWLKRDLSEVSHSSVTPNDVLQAHEKEVIEAALAQSHGRISGPAGAAAKLGIPDSTLEGKIKRLGVDKYRFKLQVG